jgi:GNAT superfamily N-acetyltransferase
MNFEITSDPERHDIDAIHAYLTRSYWSEGIARETVSRAVRNSLSFSLFVDSRAVGFARLITDRATFAYLADVYILEEFRGKGLGEALIKAVMTHADSQGFRRYLLATRGAHGLYEKFGFNCLARPEVFMEINYPDIYQKHRTTSKIS